VILLTALLPIKDMQLEIPSSEALPDNYDSKKALEVYNERFTDETTTDVFFVLKSNGDMLAQGSLNDAVPFIHQIEDDNLVSKVDSLPTALKVDSGKELSQLLNNQQLETQTKPAVESFVNNDYMLVKVTLDTKQSSNEAKEFV
ncbi:hypothetical protein KZ287_27065, partial [Escherichia coli]|nr:hypothetical protein [Escherichia coli]